MHCLNIHGWSVCHDEIRPEHIQDSEASPGGGHLLDHLKIWGRFFSLASMNIINGINSSHERNHVRLTPTHSCIFLPRLYFCTRKHDSSCFSLFRPRSSLHYRNTTAVAFHRGWRKFVCTNQTQQQLYLVLICDSSPTKPSGTSLPITPFHYPHRQIPIAKSPSPNPHRQIPIAKSPQPT